MTKVLITGASGFVGLSLLKKLSLDPSLKIIALTNTQDSKSLFQARNIIWKEVNLLEDCLDNIFSGIDVIYHLVGYSGLGKTVEDKHKLISLNETLSCRLGSHSDMSSIKHLIYVSSIAVCEDSNEAFIDELNGYYISEYGASKKRTEDLLKKSAINNFELTILRPTALFGKNHKGSIFELAKRVKEKKFFIFGTGKNTTNFYYIEEFSEVLMQVMLNKDFYGNTYIASSDPITLNSLVETIATSLDMKSNFIKLPLFLGYFFAYIFDIFEFLSKKELPFSSRRMKAMTKSRVYKNDKLQASLNDYKPQTLEGISDTISWFKESGNLK
tara:strand:- start:537 stop:1520 length:984 start_codon:yes stop_codon:yes gene_type:complete